VTIHVVGRDEELDVLHAFLHPRRAAPAALVLEGEAGIGKSTLWLAAVAAAREGGLRVLATRPAEPERAVGYAGLGDLLEDALDETLLRLPPPRRRALEAALHLREAPEPADPHAVAVAVRSVVRALADEGRLLLAVDDLQWLDPASAAALAFTVRRLADEPVLVLLSCRRGEGIERTELEGALEGEPLRVGPLSAGAVRQLLRDRLGAALPRSTLLRIHEVSGGNPFFALELARALAGTARDVSAAEPLPAPQTVRELVGRRLAALSRATRDTLLVAAASARPRRALLSRAALVEALDAEVLTVEGENLRFAHPLLASVLYGDATPAERRAVHAKLARDLPDAVEAARHLGLSTSAPDEAVAAKLEAAAVQARARGAPASAAELMEQAVALTPEHAAAARVRRAVEAARYHVDAGDDRAEPLLEAVLPLTAGDTRAEALRLLGLHRRERAAFGAEYALLREALAHVEEPALEAQIRVALVNPLFNAEVDRMEDGPEHARRAVELAEAAGEPGLLSSALASRAHLDFTLSRRVPLDELGRAAELERRSAPLHMLARLTLARVQLWTARPDAACAVLRPLYEEARDAGLRWEFTSLSFLLDAETRAGNLVEAERLADEFVAIAWPTDRSLARMVALLGRALVRAWAGDVDAVREDGDRAIELADAIGFRARLADTRWVRGFVELSVGDPAAAHGYLGLSVERVLAGGAGAPARHVPLFRDAAEALAELGRPGDVRALVGWLRDDSENPWAVAAAAHAHGVAAAAADAVEEALAALADAAGQLQRLPLPLEHARALLALGAAQRRARRRREARESLERAAALFDERGARLWSGRARAELGSIGGRRRQEGLTAAERRVAELVAEGRTNREVAAALFLGERTVETHLSHVYAKLGVRSRTELARILNARS
jgi:DNA-binding CsgD family transcriptional regulator